MNPSSTRTRLLLTFLAGVAAAAVVVGIGRQGVAASRYDDLGLFAAVVSQVKRNYVEPVDEGHLITSAIHGMISDLDPHSAFMEPAQFREMQIDTRGEFHGLGIEIVKAPDSFVEVVSPIEGTPAARAGIQARDRITSICPTEVPDDWAEGERCRSTKDMTLFDAVQLMRGKKGTEITVEIFREGFDAPRPFTIVRDVVKTPSVTARLLEPGYVYVKITAFQEHTQEDLHSKLAALHAQAPGGFQGLVLDLRNNPGGLLDQAVRVANNWIDEGLIVYTQGREQNQRQEFKARPEDSEPGYPIAVLVNAGSASASEIVAGALQDHKRALVLGQKTFGKGSVQTVYPIGKEHGLRLTTALYYTPSGRTIQEVGIEPDIPVELEPRIAQAQGPRRVRESDLAGHFTNAEAQHVPQGETDAGVAQADASAGSEQLDAQLERALEVLKSWAYFRHLEGDPAGAQAAVARADAADADAESDDAPAQPLAE